MPEKKVVLLCVVPGETYVDSQMKTWEYDEHFGVCMVCDKQIYNEFCFIHEEDDMAIHEDCVQEVVPDQMFPVYAETANIHNLVDRFQAALIECDKEFTRHLEVKGDSWLQNGTDWLFTEVQKVAAKLLLCDTRDDQLEETIDLTLVAMMLVERYIRNKNNDADDVPF